MPNCEDYLNKQQPRLLEEFFEFLRIPSISSLPEHSGDIRHAADWVANRLKAAGMENTKVFPTGAHAVTYGDWLHAPGKPTILIYGHFDTQPVDPLNLWVNPPFEPTLRDGRIYARGVSDNKGGVFVSITAVEALMKTAGKLPVNLKFLIEGQEELGSPDLPAFIDAHKDMLACDLVVSSDGTQWSETEPALQVGLRGLAGVEIDMYGANTDLHSGIYGGAVQNPLHAMVRLLDTMRAPDGRIAVEGFYDDVATLSAEERAEIAKVPFDEEKYREELGVPDLFGEPGYTPLERLWIRPTLELNGVWGGFQGEGIKTVLPKEAHAKITCRLAPNQDPVRIQQLLKAHVEKHAPRGVRTEVKLLPGIASPYVIPADHPGNQAARAVLKEMYGMEPYHIRTGGTVPVCGTFQRYLGAFTVTFAFGMDDEKFHAPNEFFRVSSLQKGQVGYCKLLERLAQ
jgi:acetylornithine deacetylase/succinyl-diaminopimelate desuccinylase-like protein